MKRIFNTMPTDEGNWQDFATCKEAFEELEVNERLEVGVTFSTGYQTTPEAQLYISTAEDILEKYIESVYDNNSEWAEDRTGGDLVNVEAKAELNAYLNQWANTYITPSFFYVENDEEIIVTQEMITAFKNGQEIVLPEFKYSAPKVQVEVKQSFTPNVDTQSRIIKWFVDGQTGRSSECMAYTIGLQQIGSTLSSPYDPSDFHRCLKLLEAVPELRGGLDTMRKVSPIWNALIDQWSELEVTFMNEIGSLSVKNWNAPKTYEMLKQIRNDIIDLAKTSSLGVSYD